MYKILYEDNHLLVINKIPGELSQGDKTGDITVTDKYKEYLRVKYKKPGNVFLGLVHRIDRPVSGALILARTGKALSRMTMIIKERKISKEYIAQVHGVPPHKDILKNWLLKDKSKNKVRVFNSGRKGKEAQLSYELVRVEGKISTIKIVLDTGRSHQIRAQLSHAGFPVVGDQKYGSDDTRFKGVIALHSARVLFEHPVKKEPVDITASFETNEYLQKLTTDELF